jgi:hypothetical protein
MHRPGLCAVAICSIGLVLWAQSGPPSDSQTEEDIRLADWAILDPAGYNAEMEKHKTKEDLVAEELARLAIEFPDEYNARFITKNADERAAEDYAFFAIMDPFAAAAEADKDKDGARRQAEAEALQAIANPTGQKP